MDRYGLIGYPLKHSLSYVFFNNKFDKEQIDAEYINFEIASLDEFKTIVNSDCNLKGLNVTIPYKELIINYLDEIDSDCAEIGAVNVIKFERGGDKLRLVGYNSDVLGFQHSIAPLIDPAIHHKALVLGTGGASKAVIQGLKRLGLTARYVSRTKNASNFLYEELDNSILEEYTVIVNSSPVGTFPNIDDAPHIPYHLLTPNHLLYDLVYNPEQTVFMKNGSKYGAKVKNGKEMLQLQALAAWEIWNK